VIMPQFFESRKVCKKYDKYPSVPEGFVFRSDVNDMWLNQDDLKEMLREVKIE